MKKEKTAHKLMLQKRTITMLSQPETRRIKGGLTGNCTPPSALRTVIGCVQPTTTVQHTYACVQPTTTVQHTFDC